MSEQPQILILGDSLADAELVARLLRTEFHRIALCCDPAMFEPSFSKYAPQVVVLVFHDLDRAQRCYLGLYRHAGAASHPHRSVLLCQREDVPIAYSLCRDRYCDDYVPFWPAGYDAPRLLMAAHQAWRLLDACGGAAANRPAALAEPPAPQEAAAPAAPASASVAATAAPSVVVPSQPLLLIVDDDSFQHRLLTHLLSSTGWNLWFASSGTQALALLRQRRPDLVLMDIDLPDGSGVEFTRQIKAQPALASMPVVMITGHSEKQLVIDSLKAGASDYVVKPFDREVVLAKLRHCLTPLGD